MSNPRSPNLAIRALQDGSVELDVFDAIGAAFDGITTKHVAALLGQHPGKPVRMRINSPGGSAAEGAAIYNLLASHGAPVAADVIGVAASAASIVAMAAKPLRMAENALLMIHDPWDMVVGNAEDLRKEADSLDKDGQALARTYARKTGKDVEEMRAMMRAETWLDSDEAVALGFADEVVEPSSAAAYLGDKQREPLFKFHRMPAAAAAFLRCDAERPHRPLGAAWRAAGGSPAAAVLAAASTQTPAPIEAPTKDTMHPDQIKLLGLAEGADASAITAAISTLKARAKLADDLETAAGAVGPEAVGKVRGLVDSAAQLGQRVEVLESDAQRGELVKLLDEHSKPAARKVTPATRAHYEAGFAKAADKGAFVADLRGYLAVAPTVGGAEPRQPITSASASAAAPVTGPGGKAYRDMTSAERDALWRSDPESFRALRDDFKRQA